MSLNEKGFAGTVLMNKAGLYQDHNIYDTAYQIQKLAKELKLEGDASQRSIAMSDLNIGNVLLELNELSEAGQYIDGALLAFIQLENTAGLTSGYISRGQLKFKRKEYQAAITDCKKGKELAMSEEILDLQQKACDCLFKAYKMFGNTVEALANHELLKSLSDSLRSSENTKYITQLEMQYNFDKVEEKRLIREQADLLILKEKDARN
jgi:hypothetical protein